VGYIQLLRDLNNGSHGSFSRYFNIGLHGYPRAINY
jgi:hypothetical protein